MDWRKYLKLQFRPGYLGCRRRLTQDQSTNVCISYQTQREINFLVRWLTCLMATVSPVALSIPLYTTPKLPPRILVNFLFFIMIIKKKKRLTTKLLQDLVVLCKPFVSHLCLVVARGIKRLGRRSKGYYRCYDAASQHGILAIF